MRVATPRVGTRHRDRRQPFEHDSRTASGAAGRPAGGSPGVRPGTRGSWPDDSTGTAARRLGAMTTALYQPLSGRQGGGMDLREAAATALSVGAPWTAHPPSTSRIRDVGPPESAHLALPNSPP